MKKHILLIAAGLLFFSSCAQRSMDYVVNNALGRAHYQAFGMAKVLENDVDSLPRTYNGRLVKSSSHWWTSGFFPGVLWLLYEATGDYSLKYYAELYSSRLTDQQFTTDNHDVGFILNCSFGNGYRLTKNPEYAQILMNGAKSLSTRYNDKVGLIRSWDNERDKWKYPVIIDNMMNLELLEWASHYSHNKHFDDIAQSHANKTMKNHFRPDYSSFHVVSYDPETGLVEKKNTHQGYSDSSAWARGQAWGLYGYTMMYRETHDRRYLNHACHIARYILNNKRLPADGIPYWDFDDPAITHTNKDASAGAIMASALIELSSFCNSQQAFADSCMNLAERQIRTLSSKKYLSAKGKNGYFILKHSVGNKPMNSEVDVPLTYADYYYVEALLRMRNYIYKLR